MKYLQELTFINQLTMTKTYRNIEYTYIVSETWNGIKFDNYHCNDKNLLDGLDTSMFTKLSEQDMKDEIDHLIDQRQDLLQIQDQGLFSFLLCHLMIFVVCLF